MNRTLSAPEQSENLGEKNQTVAEIQIDLVT